MMGSRQARGLRRDCGEGSRFGIGIGFAGAGDRLGALAVAIDAVDFANQRLAERHSTLASLGQGPESPWAAGGIAVAEVLG